MAVKNNQANQSDAEYASQLSRFIDAARQLGCDEEEAAFDEKLKKVTGNHDNGDKNAIKNVSKKSDR